MENCTKFGQLILSKIFAENQLTNTVFSASDIVGINNESLFLQHTICMTG